MESCETSTSIDQHRQRAGKPLKTHVYTGECDLRSRAAQFAGPGCQGGKLAVLGAGVERGAVRVSAVTGMSGMTNQFGSGLSSHPSPPLRCALLCSVCFSQKLSTASLSHFLSHAPPLFPPPRYLVLSPSLSFSLRDLAVSWPSGKCVWGGGSGAAGCRASGTMSKYAVCASSFPKTLSRSPLRNSRQT